jgi:uncharacterized protein (TIGR02599 family)
MLSFTRRRRPRALRGSPKKSGFTLIEVLVSAAILLIILVTLVQFMNNVDQVWKSAAADPFIEAQNAFETVAQNLAAATLAPYRDYADSTGAFRTSASFVPDHLARRSDLAFVCGPSSGANGLLTASGRATVGSGVFFLSPNGYTQTYIHTDMGRLLNAMGYFVEFGDDDAVPGFSQTHAYRWRLKQVLQPAESLQIFSMTPPAKWPSTAWIQEIVPTLTTTSTPSPVPVLADNVITLIVLPELAAGDTAPALSPTFSYDSRDTTNALTLHQLPPRVRLALVVIDPISAQRLAAQNGSQAPQLVPGTLFQQSAQLTSDLTTLDNSLTAQKINHRIFQREILLPSSNWSDAPSP